MEGFVSCQHELKKKREKGHQSMRGGGREVGRGWEAVERQKERVKLKRRN